MVEPGSLHVVATPIGNLEDVTLRALRVLGEAEVLACEDTRRTGILLDRHDVEAGRLVSYHEHNEEKRTPELVAMLEEGTAVALVSDAGTPGLADPGLRLVMAAREADIRVVPVPGPSAVTAALMAAGAPTDRFQVIGFLPGRTGRCRRTIRELGTYDGTTVAYESPHRIERTLEVLAEELPAARVHVAREMTKVHETFRAGSAAEILEATEGRSWKGEITLLVDPRPGLT